MKRIAALVAASLLIAGSAWAWIECESRGGSPACGTPLHTATWTSPDGYNTEWDESYGGTASFLSVVNDTLTLTQSTSDASENVILRDNSTTFTGTEFTAYFEYRISAVSGLNANDKQDVFSTRNNALKSLSLFLTTDANGNINGLRIQDTTDALTTNASGSFLANTWYDFHITVKYSTGSNDGYIVVKYRQHGASTWIDGPTQINKTYGAGSTVDYIGLGMVTDSFWNSGTVTSNFDNWSLREEICSELAY